MISYINQYKLLFFFSWILFYLIFPTWALPISVSARAFVFLGLIVYFIGLAYIMDRWFCAIPVNRPIIISASGIPAHIKNNSWFFVICCLAVILHIPSLSLPILIIGDETQHLQAGLWLYEHIDVGWHRFFQVAFWMVIIFGLIIRKAKKTDNAVLNRLNIFSGGRTGEKSKTIVIFSLLAFFGIYFLLLRNISYYPGFIRYPHLIKLFYQVTYYIFGITHVGPRVLQLVFYLLGAVFLYRTISLFSSKESALTGATIYLFLPVVFAYASLAEVGCGTVFFITLISFHFLRFIKEGDNRDLLLASFFIGSGFMYKRSIFVMFFICVIYLIIRSMINRDSNIKDHLKVMLMSLVTIIPWMIIGKFYSWRNYKIIWSNFTPFEGKVFSFFMHIPLDISWLLFILFLCSVVFVLTFKRNTLVFFFGLLFIAYYFFLALDIANYSPRLAMTYYPAIAVYLALFLNSIIERIRWKHSFKIFYLVLSVCLISICTVPSLNAQYLSSVEFRKLRYFPSDEAMKWVKKNVQEGEKIVTIRVMSSNFYRVKYGIDKNRIVDFWYEIDKVSSPDKLKEFCRESDISYIMFPYNTVYVRYSRPSLNIFEYLKNNPDKEFVEIQKYNIDDNYIYIYKLKNG